MNLILRDLKGPGPRTMLKSGGVVLLASAAFALLIAGADALFLALVRMFI